MSRAEIIIKIKNIYLDKQVVMSVIRSKLGQNQLTGQRTSTGGLSKENI